MKHKRGMHPNSRNGFQRKYFVNHQFFSKINNNSCYVAGFIAADGNIANNRRRLTIGLQRRDEDFLQLLNNLLESNYVIRETQSYGFPQSVLTITSQQMCLDLNKNFNITPTKSLTLSPPNIKSDGEIDLFIKGYLDGDGCINFNKKSGLHLSFIATLKLTQWIINRFENIVGRKLPIAKLKNNKSFCSTKFSDKTARLLYQHYYQVDFGLERKWKKAYFNFCNNWRTKRYNEEKYRRIFDLSKKYSNAEIAKIFNCSYQNIWILKNKNRYYKDFIAHESRMMDQEVEDIEADQDVAPELDI